MEGIMGLFEKCNLWILCRALAACSLAAQAQPDRGVSPLAPAGGAPVIKPPAPSAGVLIDFYPASKVRPKANPYRLTITDFGKTPPSVSTTDPSKDVPGVTGSFGAGDTGDGSFVLMLDGRSDDTTNWVADTWSGGASHPVKGSEAGLGIDDNGGAQKVGDGEAIIWSFDLRLLNLDPGESLVMTTADFGGMDEGEHAKFWRLTGNVGSTGAGTLLATGGAWTGKITIADGDAFALTDDGRLRSVTLDIISDASLAPPQHLDAASVTEGPVTVRTDQSGKSRSASQAAGLAGLKSGTTSRPNIIMILADDMAWYDTPVRMDDRMENSAQEIMRSLKDPRNPGRLYQWNLQKLADGGMLFRNAYSGAPQCTPTRACLQTGMTAARHRLSVELGGKGIAQYDGKPEWKNFPVIPNGVRKPFPPDIVTIPEALAPMGYQCAHYGKWHLTSDPSVEGYVDSDGDTDNNAGKTYDSKDPQIPPDLENPKRIKEITDKAIAFMTQQKNAGKPFYVQLSHYAVHAPWECKQSSRAFFQNHPDVIAYNKGQTDPAKLNRKNDPAVFFGMVYELDLSIGRLLQEIENLGLTDNTYVVFKSDNGYRRFDTRNFTQPFYGAKWFLWQGGIRVPMIVKGPGIPAGTVSTANVVTYDLLPTFFEWADGDPARLRDVDGVSLKGLLEGKAPTQAFLNRSLYFHYPHYRSAIPLSVVVKGQYKLVYSWDATIRTDISVSDPRMLFDLATDPGEFHNITPSNMDLAASLYTDLDRYLTSVDAWRPRDNSAAYRADGGADFEAEGNAEERDLFAPFEGSRTPSSKLNDIPKPDSESQ
jgi:arylsulfatase A